MVNKQLLQGKWNQLKGKVKEKWGKLTDDDMTFISGKRDQLIGKIQERYGYAKDRAERELAEFEEEHEEITDEHMEDENDFHPRFDDRNKKF